MPKPLLRRILLATDFSPCASRAFDYALRFATACSAHVDLLHAVEFPPGLDPEYAINAVYLERLRLEVDRQLDALVRQAAGQGITSEGSQVVGLAGQAIVKKAKEADVDLVVVGTHGRTGLAHLLLGSTAERVIRTSPCPVLAVRGPYEEQADDSVAPSGAQIRINAILAPVDFSDCSLEASEYAAAVTRQFHAALTVLHVLEPVSFGLDFTLSHGDKIRENKGRCQAKVDELAETLRGEGIKAEPALRGGLPADSIVSAAAESGADLIVMGTHGRRGLAHFASGSVAEAVLRRSPCPVLTVKSPTFQPGHGRVAPHGAATS